MIGLTIVVGSNIANTTLVLGLTAMIARYNPLLVSPILETNTSASGGRNLAKTDISVHRRNPSDAEAGYDEHKEKCYQAQIAETYNREDEKKRNEDGCVKYDGMNQTDLSLSCITDTKNQYSLIQGSASLLYFRTTWIV